MKVFELSPSSDASLTDVSRALGNIVDPHGEQKDMFLMSRRPDAWWLVFLLQQKIELLCRLTLLNLWWLIFPAAAKLWATLWVKL